MKLLLDENLSRGLVVRLQETYPGTTHVELVDLQGTADRTIWDYAKANGFAIVSKDNDFRQRSVLFGTPPKVIWLAIGNAGTDEIGRLLHCQSGSIHDFLNQPETGLLVLSN
ncbi:MAG: DUF5615 family PIN-like protein [Gammaproteobacteria bacterium]|nr:DUF5615 family PIN-like protein [Gammaproteobacteria bacterium]